MGSAPAGSATRGPAAAESTAVESTAAESTAAESTAADPGAAESVTFESATAESATAESVTAESATPRSAAAPPTEGSGAAADPGDEAAPFAAAPVEARRLEQHFVYNSLNAIASLIRTDPARARELLVGFADLSRATDRPTDAPSTLGHELATVRDYLALEQARFGKRLRVEIEVNPALRRAPVEPLRLLAAVRDAVQRDIEPRAQGGVLSVTARPTAGGCVVTVTGGAGEARVLDLTAHVTV